MNLRRGAVTRGRLQGCLWETHFSETGGVGTRMIVAAVLLAAVIGCSDDASLPSAPADIVHYAADGVAGRVENGVLEIRNGTPAPIIVTAVETRFFYTAFALWCFGHDQCGTVVTPEATVRIPVADISGYTTDATTVEVFWWARGAEPARVNAIRVPAR